MKSEKNFHFGIYQYYQEQEQEKKDVFINLIEVDRNSFTVHIFLNRFQKKNKVTFDPFSLNSALSCLNYPLQMWKCIGLQDLEVHHSPLPSQRIRVSKSGFCKPFHLPLCWPAKLNDNARLLTQNAETFNSILIIAFSPHNTLVQIL